MEINPMALECYAEKEKFIKNISKVIAEDGRMGVKEVRYEVYNHKEWGEQEYLIVVFRGGAISVRNVNINSNLANFMELGQLLRGGYYSEVKDYQEIIEDPEWERIKLS